MLQAAHVREGDYFSSRVHHDIDAIIEDIREAHRGRSDSAPENTIVNELKRDLEEVASFEGSRAEQLLMVFCKQTKLRYNRLTEEEKQWPTRIVQKSELAKSYVPQRGKRKKRVTSWNLRRLEMLILCSNGLSSSALKSSLSSTIKSGKSTLVVTADNEYKENNYHVARCISKLNSLHLDIDIIDIDKQPIQDLLIYDVVEFIGGNPYYLLKITALFSCRFKCPCPPQRQRRQSV